METPCATGLANNGHCYPVCAESQFGGWGVRQKCGGGSTRRSNVGSSFAGARSLLLIVSGRKRSLLSRPFFNSFPPHLQSSRSAGEWVVAAKYHPPGLCRLRELARCKAFCSLALHLNPAAHRARRRARDLRSFPHFRSFRSILPKIRTSAANKSLDLARLSQFWRHSGGTPGHWKRGISWVHLVCGKGVGPC